MTSAQANNGKAFEWAIGCAASSIIKADIEKSFDSENACEAFNKMRVKKQKELTKSAVKAVTHIAKNEKSVLQKSKIKIIKFNSDAAGEAGDVRDVIIVADGKEIGISCKHNHEAWKHPRLSQSFKHNDKTGQFEERSRLDFVKAWGLDPAGCSNTYWDTVGPLFKELSIKRHDSDQTMTWEDLGEGEFYGKIQDVKCGKYYKGVLNAWREEIRRLRGISITSPQADAIKEAQVAKSIISYLVGKHDFYKVIFETANRSKQVRIQGFNFNKTLSIKKTKYPTKIENDDSQNGGQYAVTLTFNEGYKISFRIHNASSRVEPSFKLDIQTVNDCHGDIYQHVVDLDEDDEDHADALSPETK